MALAAICTADELQSSPLLETFLNAGGVAAIVPLLRTSTCPVTLACAAKFIEMLLDPQGTPQGRSGYVSNLAESLLQSGELRHVVNCGSGK
jgi:hypothetical protein